jgi:hypothetical protein
MIVSAQPDRLSSSTSRKYCGLPGKSLFNQRSYNYSLIVVSRSAKSLTRGYDDPSFVEMLFFSVNNEVYFIKPLYDLSEAIEHHLVCKNDAFKKELIHCVSDRNKKDLHRFVYAGL